MATQRTRTASKALIPSLTDPVGKLNGRGGMTVKKLLELGSNVRESKSGVLSELPLLSASTGELPHGTNLRPDEHSEGFPPAPSSLAGAEAGDCILLRIGGPQ